VFGLLALASFAECGPTEIPARRAAVDFPSIRQFVESTEGSFYAGAFFEVAANFLGRQARVGAGRDTTSVGMRRRAALKASGFAHPAAPHRIPFALVAEMGRSNAAPLPDGDCGAGTGRLLGIASRERFFPDGALRDAWRCGCRLQAWRPPRWRRSRNWNGRSQ
jgi:hypothetical protein